jgi:prolyl oligopeptidase
MSVGSWWVTEYGSADDPKQFEYLRRYSPYHNVKPGTQYPAVLFVTGDSDTRVDPAHARKMTALMQSANASSNPILLRYDAKGGHSGIGSVNKNIEEDVDMLSFLSSRLGFQFD